MSLTTQGRRKLAKRFSCVREAPIAWELSLKPSQMGRGVYSSETYIFLDDDNDDDDVLTHTFSKIILHHHPRLIRICENLSRSTQWNLQVPHVSYLSHAHSPTRPNFHGFGRDAVPNRCT